MARVQPRRTTRSAFRRHEMELARLFEIFVSFEVLFSATQPFPS
jgi:hypothetical protein